MEMGLQMSNGGGNETSALAGGGGEVDIEKEGGNATAAVAVVVEPRIKGGGSESAFQGSGNGGRVEVITIVASNGEARGNGEPAGKVSSVVDSNNEESVSVSVVSVDSSRKDYLSRTSSSHEQCRVCQQDKEEVLIELGCRCRGGLAKAHRSCIEIWFRTKGSNQCEICQDIASNVSPPEPHPTANYWVWRVDPSFRGYTVSQERERGCFGPLWIAFLILIGCLLLDVFISVILGVSALPVNVIIGVIVLIGLGTAVRLALEFCHDWSVRRVVQRMDASVNLGYHPAL